MAGAATAQRTNFHQGLKFGLLTGRECDRQWRTANRKSIELRQAALRLSTIYRIYLIDVEPSVNVKIFLFITTPRDKSAVKISIGLAKQR